MSGPEVVVVGDVMTDVVTRHAGPIAPGSDTPAKIGVHGGGSAANVAAWLADLDVPVTFIGKVGADAFGDAAVAELRDAGVRVVVAVDAEAPTGTCVVLVGPDGERTFLPDRGANATFSPRDLAALPDDLFRPGRHLHLSSYLLLAASSRAAGLEVLARARAARMTVSVDPASAAPLALVGATEFLGWTRGAQLMFANAEEATVLTGRTDPREAAAALAEDYREVVVKCGAAGSVWHGGFLAASAAAERVLAVDTTGAGDAFAAGFLAEWLLHPEPETALARGNRTAARAVERIGARP